MFHSSVPVKMRVSGAELDKKNPKKNVVDCPCKIVNLEKQLDVSHRHRHLTQNDSSTLPERGSECNDRRVFVLSSLPTGADRIWM